MNNEYNNNFENQVPNNNFEPIQPVQPQPVEPVQPVPVAPVQPVQPQPVVQPTPVVEQPINNKPKKSFNKLLIIIPIIVIALVVGLILVLTGKGGSSSNGGGSISGNAFTFSVDGKYVLYSNGGKKITNTVFDSASEFKGGASIVEKDGEKGLINENGKMIVDFGESSYIRNYGDFYKVYLSGGKEKLLDGSGKVLYEMNSVDVEQVSYGSNAYVLKDYSNQKLIILNKSGKEILTLPYGSTSDLKSMYAKGIESITFEDTVYIVDYYDGTLYGKFNSKELYRAEYKSPNGVVVVEPVYSSKEDENYYMVASNGVAKDFTKSCYKVGTRTGKANEFVTCNLTYAGKYALIKSNLEISNDSIYYTQYTDDNNYAKESENTTAVEFYKDNKLVNTVNCMDLSEIYTPVYGYYVLLNSTNYKCKGNGKYVYYNEKGEKAFNGEYEEATAFDKNGFAIVKNEEGKYHLINKKGEKVGNTYNEMSRFTYTIKGDSIVYYDVKNDSGAGIVNSAGKEVIEPIYSYVQDEDREDNVIAVANGDNKSTVYNLSANKVILESKNYISLDKKYLTVDEGKQTVYYTFSGKKFYSEKN